MPKVLFSTATGRVISAGYCEFYPIEGQAVFEVMEMPNLTPGGPPPVVDGGAIRPMNTQELAAWAAEQIDKESDLNNASRILRAIVLVCLDQFNVLRVRAGLQQVTVEQMIQAIKQKY